MAAYDSTEAQCRIARPWRSRRSTRSRTASSAPSARCSSTASSARPPCRSRSRATSCGPRTRRSSSTPACRRARCPGFMRTDRLAQFTDADLLVHRLERIGARRATTSTWSCSRTCTTTTRAAPSSSVTPSSSCRRTSTATRTTRRRSSRASTTGRTSTCRAYRWRLLDGDTELAPGVTVLRTDGHTPGHQSLMVELPETRARDPHGRCVLLARARGERARAGRGVEPHARPPLDQAPEDAGAV